MGLFKAFFASCRGPLSFVELRRQAGWRVVLHLFLTVLISCIFVAVGRYCALKYFWSRPEQLFVENFGEGINVSSVGMLPAKDADVSRRQELPYEGLLIYISPQGPEKNYPDETLAKRNFILLWTPGQFALAVRNHKTDRWTFAGFSGDAETMVSQAVGKNGIRETGNLTLDALRKEMMDVAKKPLAPEFAGMKNKKFIPAQELFKTMRGGMAAFNGAVYFCNAFMLIFFGAVTYMLIFAVLEMLPGSERKIPAGEMWKIVLYSACPVIVVVNVFPMLQLPFESFYEKIFLVGWIIYINVIKRYLEKNPDLLENPKE